jgi:hypothetical protein
MAVSDEFQATSAEPVYQLVLVEFQVPAPSAATPVVFLFQVIDAADAHRDDIGATAAIAAPNSASFERDPRIATPPNDVNTGGDTGLTSASPRPESHQD